MPEKQESSTKLVRFSSRTVLAGFVLVSAALAVIVKVRENQRFSALESRIVEGLMQISLGLLTHLNTSDNGLPSPLIERDRNGLPLSSWRLPLVGRITSVPYGYDRRLPWNAEVNKPATTWPCWVYCFSDDSSKTACDTNIFAIAGEGTLFYSDGPIDVSEIDGDLVVAMEVADSGTHWMEPGDYKLQELQRCNGTLSDCVKSLLTNRIHVLFADGSVWCLSGATPMDRIRNFFTMSGARSHSRDDELEAYCLKKWKIAGVVE